MFSFYIWIILNFVANLVWLFLSVAAAEEQLVFIVFMPATFKVLFGFEQIWLMLELIASVNTVTRHLSLSQQGTDVTCDITSDDTE